jgi:uncharacterized protein YjiS (DUF1127 family)
MKLNNSTIHMDTYLPRADERPSDASSASVRVSRLWRLLLTLLSVWGERNRSRRYLAQSDDSLLKDIGLTRAEARSEAGKPFWMA